MGVEDSCKHIFKKVFQKQNVVYLLHIFLNINYDSQTSLHKDQEEKDLQKIYITQN